MIRNIVTVIIILLCSIEAKSQKADTARFFYKYNGSYPKKVSTADSADFIRLILPHDSQDKLYIVKEFYKDGTIKFAGKSNRGQFDAFHTGEISLQGNCVAFFKNGKRQVIGSFNYGVRSGLEYEYYPEGKPYAINKYLPNGSRLRWANYDKNGNMLCKDGNGTWLIWDSDFKNISLEGPIINGFMDGNWHGITRDSIKYIYTYKNNIFLYGRSYDTEGKEHVFNKPEEGAQDKDGIFIFLKKLASYLNLPKADKSEESILDTTHISFVVERDGHLTQFKISEKVPSKFANAMINALAQCPDWIPTKHYGLPKRTRVTFSWKMAMQYKTIGNLKFDEQFLDPFIFTNY